MNLFTLLTPVTYWILIVLWSFILIFYIKRLRDKSLKGQLISVLLAILAIDAFRTLFESLYFGAWYTALAGFLPQSVHTFLVRPEMVFIPKILNVVAAGLVIILLLFKWLPKEEQEKGRLKQIIQEQTLELTKKNEALNRSNQLLSKNLNILDDAQKIAHLGHFEYTILDETLYWSPEVYRIFGQDAKTFTPSYDGYLSLIHKKDRGYTQEKYTRSLEHKTPFDFEIRIHMDDGTIKYIQNKGENEYDPSGQPTKTIGMILDITDRKRHETEQEQLQARLIQAQKMESVGRLAGGVAHDFNNMLTIILGNTEIILEDLDGSEPIIDNLKEVQNAAQRSSTLTRQLLAFARKQTISPRPLDLNLIIEGMLNMLKRLIGKDIELSWKPNKELWLTKIDPSQVDQILANLCVNARDSIKDVGKIFLETDNVHLDHEYCNLHMGSRPGDYISILIRDTGCGMNKKTIENLFEPFFTTKKIGEGTGLGLSTVYGIVKQNNGFIDIDSELEKGTSFRIYLAKHTEKTDDDIHENE